MTKDKSQADLEIEALADVFGIATTGFEEFHKTCEKNSKGTNSKAASSGYNSKAASSGENSTAASSGYNSKADIVDGEKLKANCWYIVEKKKWVEVDMSDGIFSRVISTKGRVKKVKTDEGKILFVAFDDNGNSAHGNTIKEARADLVYKVVAKFDGAIPKKATGKEWIGIYRAVTGACGAGVRMFVEKTGKSLDDTYTDKQIIKLIQGQYGAEKFAERVNKAA